MRSEVVDFPVWVVGAPRPEALVVAVVSRASVSFGDAPIRLLILSVMEEEVDGWLVEASFFCIGEVPIRFFTLSVVEEVDG